MLQTDFKLNVIIINKIIHEIYALNKLILSEDKKILMIAEENGISRELFSEYYYTNTLKNVRMRKRIDEIYEKEAEAVSGLVLLEGLR